MVNKSKKILSEISAGELLDKISILEIKLEKIQDKESHEEINKEYRILKEAQNLNIKITENVKIDIKITPLNFLEKLLNNGR